MRKLRIFEEYHRQHADEKEWGIGNFRVVIVLLTADRVINLCKRIARSFSTREVVFQRLCLTDFGRYSIDEPERILGKIFSTPEDGHARRPLQLPRLTFKWNRGSESIKVLIPRLPVPAAPIRRGGFASARDDFEQRCLTSPRVMVGIGPGGE